MPIDDDDDDVVVRVSCSHAYKPISRQAGSQRP